MERNEKLAGKWREIKLYKVYVLYFQYNNIQIMNVL
jgi:hypothetical protein